MWNAQLFSYYLHHCRYICNAFHRVNHHAPLQLLTDRNFIAIFIILIYNTFCLGTTGWCIFPSVFIFSIDVRQDGFFAQFICLYRTQKDRSWICPLLIEVCGCQCHSYAGNIIWLCECCALSATSMWPNCCWFFNVKFTNSRLNE